MSLPFLPRRAIPAAAVVALAFVACGARGPLDVEIVQETPADAAVEANVVEAGVDAADATDAADAPDETGRPGFDGGPLVNCGQCIAQSCGQQLLTCITSAACRTALQCVF